MERGTYPRGACSLRVAAPAMTISADIQGQPFASRRDDGAHDVVRASAACWMRWRYSRCETNGAVSWRHGDHAIVRTKRRSGSLPSGAWEVIDFLVEHPSIKISPQEFVDTLAQIAATALLHRLELKSAPQIKFTSRSISCATRATVDNAAGVCSTFMADRGRRSSHPDFSECLQIPTAGGQ